MNSAVLTDLQCFAPTFPFGAARSAGFGARPFRLGGTNEMETTNWITIIAVMATALAGIVGFVVAKMDRRADKTEAAQSENDKLIAAVKALIDERGPRHDRAEDRQTHHGETLAGAVARIGNLEESSAKVADALERLVRIEEWRSTHADPKLLEVDRTARAVAGIQSDIKTLFHRVEEMAERQESMPDAIVDKLMTRVRTQPRAASNG